MADKGTTIMVLEVDLQCHRCYKKVKKVLCKFPQIHDQIYDEKKNTVKIKVVCCSPQKIMKKIRCKGGDCIKSIEILPPPIVKPPPEKKEPEKKEPEKKEPEKKEPEKKEPEKKEPQKKEKAPPPEKEPAPHNLTLILPSPCPTGLPIGVCCRQCYEGHSGGPCFHGHERPRPCYGGRPVYDSYGGGWYRGTCYVTRCDYYCEENPAGCVVM